ncbi:MAG TPA: ABC transporter permease [Clostridia bacterium]|nr:ABC transporter permease [Clostridia bacterium]
MNGFIAFFKKEALESLRTYKLLVVFAVFAVLGVASPVAAKLMPEILAAMPMEGMTLILPTPTALDAWSQFFKNLTQMGLIVLLLVLSGQFSTEYAKGTLVNLLTKGLSRPAVALAKAAWAAVLWTGAYVLAMGISAGYTVYLFPGEAVENVFPAVAALWVFGLLLISCLSVRGGPVCGPGIAGSRALRARLQPARPGYPEHEAVAGPDRAENLSLALYPVRAGHGGADRPFRPGPAQAIAGMSPTAAW